jgi:tetratricopeptide (TPR) repeat protein
MKAFLILSEKMVGLYPEHLEYLNNIGSYHLISKEDPKTALKWYSKVLKKNPKDGNALQNSIVAARRLKNAKLEKKYRDRLDALNKEK